MLQSFTSLLGFTYILHFSHFFHFYCREHVRVEIPLEQQYNFRDQIVKRSEFALLQASSVNITFSFSCPQKINLCRSFGDFRITLLSHNHFFHKNFLLFLFKWQYMIAHIFVYKTYLILTMKCKVTYFQKQHSSM